MQASNKTLSPKSPEPWTLFDMERVALMSNLGSKFASNAAEKVQEAQEAQEYVYYSRGCPVQGTCNADVF